MYSDIIGQYKQSTLYVRTEWFICTFQHVLPIGHLQGYNFNLNLLNLSFQNHALEESNPKTRNLAFYQKKSFISKTERSQGHVQKACKSVYKSATVISPDSLSPILSAINPFWSYVGPRPTLWFSCSAPISEDVWHVFFGWVCSPAPLSELVRRFSSCSNYRIIHQPLSRPK